MHFSFRKNKNSTALKSNAPGKVYPRVHSLTEAGPVRSHNEDSIAIVNLDREGQNMVAVLADGMGGHNAGEVASSMACKIITEYIQQHHSTDDIVTGLDKALRYAHKEIKQTGENNEEQHGMGTTAVAVAIKDGSLYYAHIGDSRLYQYSNGGITQLTDDHTLVNEMYAKGEITVDERDTHPMRNMLLQALGTAAAITPQLSGQGIPLSITDKYLLCSDGIYEVFTEAELQMLMSLEDTAFMLECIRCIATDRKASDNFSTIVISFSLQPSSVSPVTREQNVML